jgi:hypothetical protein
MNKTKAFVKLDFLTVKQYFKPAVILFYTAIMIFSVYTFGNFIGGIGYGMFISTMIMPYPFAIGEKCNIDTLYSSLAIRKKNVVLGRFLYTLLLNAVLFLFSGVCALVTLYIKNKELPEFSLELFLTLSVMIAVFIFIQTLQIPMFFKIGYTRAKLFSLIPMMIVTSIGTGLLAFVRHNEFDSNIGRFLLKIADFLGKNPTGVLVIVIAFILICLYVSYKISVSVYKRREF